MKKTILITGASAGIGRATAKYFASRGWNVIATMRTPDKETELQSLPDIHLEKLDVTDTASIDTAIANGIRNFGKIDVVVNNAGYGAVGIFEKASPEQIKRQFDTNVFGVMNVIRAILPHFRSRRSGTIINVTSMGGRLTFPIYSVYHGTKWAIEGFAESLQYELRPIGIRVKNVEPGAIKTEFYERSMDLFQNDKVKGYDTYETVAYKNTQSEGEKAPGPEVVAATIFRAAGDKSFRLRYPVPIETKALLFLRWLLPLSWFNGVMGMIVEKGFKQPEKV